MEIECSWLVSIWVLDSNGPLFGARNWQKLYLRALVTHASENTEKIWQFI